MFRAIEMQMSEQGEIVFLCECVCLWRGGEGVCRVDKFEKEGTCWGKTATHALASSHSNSGRRYGPLQEPTPILSLFIIIIFFFCNYFKRSRCCLNASCKVDYLRTREFGIYLFKTGFIICVAKLVDACNSHRLLVNHVTPETETAPAAR